MHLCPQSTRTLGLMTLLTNVVRCDCVNVTACERHHVSEFDAFPLALEG